MLILLARHGNTFNPGEKTYRVGKRNDLPLTYQGIAQAELFADSLIKKHITPTAIYCSPLQRTRSFAQTIINKMNLNISPQIDENLNELDYGEWAGLTDEEVISKYPDDFKAWKEKSAWPKHSNWPENENDIINSIKKFSNNIAQKYGPNDVVLIISSCGKLRYFLKLVNNAFDERLQSGGVRVKTGNACKINYKNGIFNIESWNISPTEL